MYSFFRHTDRPCVLAVILNGDYIQTIYQPLRCQTLENTVDPVETELKMFLKFYRRYFVACFLDDLRFNWVKYTSNDYVQQTAKVLAKLFGRAGSQEPSLGTYEIIPIVP